MEAYIAKCESVRESVSELMVHRAAYAAKKSSTPPLSDHCGI
jgi:hypothetical protein